MGLMPRRDAHAQATDAGAGGAGQQDGADRLGPDVQGRHLPVSGRSGVSRLVGREDVRAEEGKELLGATDAARQALGSASWSLHGYVGDTLSIVARWFARRVLMYA